MYLMFNEVDVHRVPGGGAYAINPSKKISAHGSYALAKAAAYRRVNNTNRHVFIIKYDGKDTGVVRIKPTSIMSTIAYQDGARYWKDPLKAKAHTGVFMNSIGAKGGNGFIDSKGQIKK